MAINNLHYINYNDFSEIVPKSLAHLDKWNMLSEKERESIYYQVHEIIDKEFDYIGTAIIPGRAFPRNLKYMLDNNKNYSNKQKEIINIYDQKIPLELRYICVFLGRDILDKQDIHELLVIQDKTGAAEASLDDLTVQFAAKTSNQSYITRRDYCYEATKFLNQFNPLYFAFKG